jgi:hypothetical protein
MEKTIWTWVDGYGWLRPSLPRLCGKCNYEGYFKLRRVNAPTPNVPFMEVCPKCHSEIEAAGIETQVRFSREVEEFAERLNKTPEELTEMVLENIIMDFDPKTKRVRLVRKDNGDEISK